MVIQLPRSSYTLTLSVRRNNRKPPGAGGTTVGLNPPQCSVLPSGAAPDGIVMVHWAQANTPPLLPTPCPPTGVVKGARAGPGGAGDGVFVGVGVKVGTLGVGRRRGVADRTGFGRVKISIIPLMATTTATDASNRDGLSRVKSRCRFMIDSPRHFSRGGNYHKELWRQLGDAACLFW